MGSAVRVLLLISRVARPCLSAVIQCSQATRKQAVLRILGLFKWLLPVSHRLKDGRCRSQPPSRSRIGWPILAIPAAILLMAIAGAVITGVLRWRSSDQDHRSGTEALESIAEHWDLRIQAASSPEERQMIGLLREGCEAAERLVADHPSDSSSCHAMAVAHFELSRAQAAEQWWKRAIEIDPQFIEGYRWLAYIAMERGEYAEAKNLYLQALTIDPTYVDGRFGVSEALVAQGNFTEALQWLEKADLPLEPASGPAFLLLGQIHLELQQYEQARECF
jgi:tetratricopeptide (TPR) repeat protein